jgi:hypothetical protein
MANGNATGSTVTHSSQLERAAREVDLWRTIVGALATLVLAAFGVGITWEKLIRYEAIVDKQKDDLKRLTEEIAAFKTNLGKLGDPSYETDVSDDERAGIKCESGNVVTGVRIEGGKTWIRCASMSRAAWNPAVAVATAPRQ